MMQSEREVDLNQVNISAEDKGRGVLSRNILTVS